ncbi:MAG: efflux RND transporter periplasmic adaptor subunit [Candidatus Omnitrophota bacterium]
MNKVLRIIALIIIIGGVVFIGYKLMVSEQKKELTEVIQSGGTAGINGNSEDENTEKKSAKGLKDEAVLSVKAIRIKRGTLALRLNISATADAWEKAAIRSELGGTIDDIKVKVGSWVKPNQLMIKLSDIERKLDVEQRQAEKLRSFSQYLVSESTIREDSKITEEQKKNLEELKKKFIEAKTNYETGKITLAQFEKISDEHQRALIFSGDLRDDIRKAQEGLSTATVMLKSAEINLKRTQIQAPFEGTVGELLVSKGEKVNPGQELLRVVNLKSLYLKGFALESEIANLKIGTRVRIKFDSYPEQFHYGEIQAINPEIDATKKTITVYVKMDNKDKRFLPGMHAEIDVEYKLFEHVIKVPRNAVIYRQDRYLVFVAKEMKGSVGIANWQYVKIGHQNDDEIEILDGLNEGDMVLVDGHQTLAHQSKIRITED